MTVSDASATPPEDDERPAKTPLYPRLLRLRHVRPNAWQRALLGEGAFGVAVLLVLADLATAWTLLVLPVAVAVVVKAHDLLAGALAPAAGAAEPADAAYRSPQLGLRASDLAVIGALQDAGADLRAPRHVQHYLHVPDEGAARVLADTAAANGFTVRVGAPDDALASWSVVCEQTAVLDPGTVRRTSDLLHELARVHDAEYDGWEAAV